MKANEQKALELSSMNKYGFSIEESNAAYNAALTMAEWKDRQFKAEKQRLIDEACDAYCKVCGHYHHTVPYKICRHDCNYYDDFKKHLKGGEE